MSIIFSKSLGKTLRLGLAATAETVRQKDSYTHGPLIFTAQRSHPVAEPSVLP